MYEARVLLGRDIPSVSETNIMSYIGFGYRRLNDLGGGERSSKNSLGYDRESNYCYAPIGIGVSSGHGNGNGWRYEGRIEYDLFFSGIQKSRLTQANSVTTTYSNDLSNSQGSGYGLRVSARFIHKNRNSSHLAFEPFVRFWSIDRSAPDWVVETKSNGIQSERKPYVEPENNTTEMGLNVLFMF